MYRCIVWDWNGTLLNDVQVAFSAMNAMLSRRGLPLMESVAQYRELFTFPVREYYAAAGLDLEREAFEDLAVEWTEEYYRKYPTCGLYPGVGDILRSLGEQGARQIIVSASQQQALHKAFAQVQHHIGDAASHRGQNVLAVILPPAAPGPSHPAAHSGQQELEREGKGRRSDVRRIGQVVQGGADAGSQTAAHRTQRKAGQKAEDIAQMDAGHIPNGHRDRHADHAGNKHQCREHSCHHNPKDQ